MNDKIKKEFVLEDITLKDVETYVRDELAKCNFTGMIRDKYEEHLRRQYAARVNFKKAQGDGK